MIKNNKYDKRTKEMYKNYDNEIVCDEDGNPVCDDMGKLVSIKKLMSIITKPWTPFFRELIMKPGKKNCDKYKHKKVFCINCRHHRRLEYYKAPRLIDLCNLTKTLNDSAVTKYLTYEYCVNLNEDNNCKNYKKKWWKK